MTDTAAEDRAGAADPTTAGDCSADPDDQTGASDRSNRRDAVADDRRQVLFVHSVDVRTPLGSTAPYYISQITARHHEVHVICRALEHAPEQSDADVVYHPIDVGNVRIVSNLLYLLLSTLLGAYVAVRRRVDVVYCFQYCLLQGWVAAQVARARYVVGLQSVPVRQYEDFGSGADHEPRLVRTVARLLGRGYVSIAGFILRRADRVTCLTTGIRDLAAATFGVDLTDARVVPLGVDTETFRRPRTAKPEADAGPWDLVYVGTVRDDRDLETVVRAVATSQYDVHLHVAGTGPPRDVRSLQQTVRECGISDSVTWHGFVPHRDVPVLLSRADVALSPLSDIESYRVSFPAKLLEYLAAGLLVVARDLEPHRRLVSHRENGYLYDGTVQGLRRSLRTCLENPAEHPELRAAARETAMEYDWERIYRCHATAMFGDGEGAER